MRFATSTQVGTTGIWDIAATAAAVDGRQQFPLPDGVSVLGLIHRGESALRDAGERALAQAEPVPLDEVRLLPPLSPPAIRDFVAFEAHIEGVVQAIDGLAQTPKVW